VRRAALCAGVLVAACGGSLPGGWVYVTAVTSNAASVVWTAARPADAVRCRGAAGETVEGTTTATRRGLRVTRLEGLAAARAYRCTIGPRRIHFRTAPAGNQPFTFAVVGDTGDGSPAAAALARRIRAGRPAFLIHLGDLAYGHGGAALLEARFFRPYRRTLARIPLFSTPGNHDLHGRSVYTAVFPPAAPAGSHDGLLYAFEWGAAHFVSASYRDVAGGGAAGRWVADDLRAARARPWRILFLHEPPYSPGQKYVAPGLRAALVPILEAGAVDLLLTGHQHFYAHAEPFCEHGPGPGVLEVISGGGGENLDPPAVRPNFPRVVSVTHYLRVRVTDEALDVRAVDVRGHVFDHVRRARNAPAACRSEGWPPPRER